MCSLYYDPLFLSPQFGGLEAVITGVCDIVPWLDIGCVFPVL